MEEKTVNGETVNGESVGIRNHFSKVITDTLKSIWAFIFIGVVNIAGEADEIMSSDGVATGISKFGIFMVLFIVLLILAVFLFNFFRWRKTYITIDDENLVLTNNYLVQKKVTTIRLTSIATVNFQQGILERLFGTYRLQVDINSSVTADSTDFNLVFDKETAERIKAVLTNKSQQSGSFKAVKTAEVSSAPDTERGETKESKLIYKFTMGQVLKHCVLSLSPLIILLIAAVAIVTVVALRFIDENRFGMIFTALIMIVPLVSSQLKPLISYYDFKIEKEDERAVVSYGLFTHRQYNLPLSKTNAIIIHQPLLARIFGYYYGELINVGMGDEDNDGTPIFCLALKADEIKAIIKELKPEMQTEGLGEGSPMSAYVPTCIPYLVFSVICIAVSAYFGYWWIGLTVLVLFMLFALLSVKTKSLAVLKDKAVITAGVFHKRTVVVPNDKIQNISVSSNPISRRFGLVHGKVTILAMMIYQEQEIGYFKAERLDGLFNNIVYTDDK